MSSDPESPPTKRQRTENASIVRSNVWYKDGSVILQAQNTQFRVHWSVLAKNSSFFRDLEALPQPADQPSVENCPIIQVQDSAEDVRHLLEALYDPVFMVQEMLPFPAVAALIRLGRKYEIRHLLDLAVERLVAENPATLADFDLLHERRGSHLGEHILTALPCAYYRATVLNYGTCVSRLFDGIPRGDGSEATLSHTDQARCVSGHTNLLREQAKEGYTFGWLRIGSDRCTTLAKCNLQRAEHLTKYLDDLRLRALAPVHALAELPGCTTCQKSAKEAMEAGRQRVWEQLPSYFDLPPWSELKNDL
ncbi:hypothetical protein FB45DRAFT_894359 [Roridomyces roridus]|uniref:BTB domain-containing protein n=1 Tax=Roridomyces roridus TaxID=1738132 RepID=A0AAD7FX22_9AGAR|nr:hypothetical protein FB45DRAFT_894359 [Roridomyces roridus]